MFSSFANEKQVHVIKIRFCVTKVSRHWGAWSQNFKHRVDFRPTPLHRKIQNNKPWFLVNFVQQYYKKAESLPKMWKNQGMQKKFDVEVDVFKSKMSCFILFGQTERFCPGTRGCSGKCLRSHALGDFLTYELAGQDCTWVTDTILLPSLCAPDHFQCLVSR